MPTVTVQAVVFDSGETLFDESRAWAEWADWLGIPRFTFMAVLGGVIARGEHHLRVFELLRPGFDLDAALAERGELGNPHAYAEDDLYPDARSCLRQLREDGYTLGVAGNYGMESEESLRSMDLPVDFIGSSERWGAAKPSSDFFLRLVQETGLTPEHVAYVGDRLDNDIVPSMKVGLLAVHIRRGPWAFISSDHHEADGARLGIDSLDELPGLLKGDEATRRR